MEELYEQLKKPLPEGAVKPHPTKTYLSSIKAIYVTERLTEVFGLGKWTTKVQEINHNQESGMVVVKVTLEIPEHGIYYESYGGNDNGGSKSKNFDLGDAYKGATTDAITKIGSYLGIGIDVFKGFGDAKNSEQDDDSKEWLNMDTVEWNNAVSKKVPLKQVREFYKVSKANAEQYLKAIQ